MKIRDFCPDDAPLLATLFFETIHTVNVCDYTLEQLKAWAPDIPEAQIWARSFEGRCALVAEVDGGIVGFADMDMSGYLNRLYVHRHHLRCGVATALCDELERRSTAVRFTTHASLTARLFFEHRGYRVLQEQRVERHGVLLTNFVMECREM